MGIDFRSLLDCLAILLELSESDCVEDVQENLGIFKSYGMGQTLHYNLRLCHNSAKLCCGSLPHPHVITHVETCLSISQHEGDSIINIILGVQDIHVLSVTGIILSEGKILETPARIGDKVDGIPPCFKASFLFFRYLDCKVYEFLKGGKLRHGKVSEHRYESFCLQLIEVHLDDIVEDLSLFLLRDKCTYEVIKH